MESKRGQDLTIGTLVLIALGVVVLVLLVLGFWKGWDFVFGWLDLAGETDLDILAQKCAGLISAGFTSSYCSIVEVKYQGTTQYMNCVSPEVQTLVRQRGVSPDGAQWACENKAAEYCTSKGSTFSSSDALVNGKACSVWTAGSVSGPPAPTA